MLRRGLQQQRRMRRRRQALQLALRHVLGQALGQRVLQQRQEPFWMLQGRAWALQTWALQELHQRQAAALPV